MRAIWLLFSLLSTIFILFYSKAFSFDYNDGVEELYHMNEDSVLSGNYLASWYDPDSNNYFILNGTWNYGTAIIKTTDPSNPVRIVNFRGGGGIHQDVKVIGDYAYIATFGWYSNIRNLYILHMQSEYPYYDTNNVVTIPFADDAGYTLGTTCDTIPLGGDHTIFGADGRLYVTEGYNEDDVIEVAILDVSATPAAPKIVGLIDTTGIEADFNGAHSVCAVGDTIYTSQWRGGMYRIVVDPTNDYSVISWGKILYNSYRRGVDNSDPLLGQYEDSLWVIDWHPLHAPYYDPCGYCDPEPCSCWVHYVKPGSHSNYLAPDGYLLACDEGNTDQRWSNQQDTMACILRVFDTADFDTLLDTVTVYGALDVIWSNTSPYLEYSVDISEMDGSTWPAETPCPDNCECSPEDSIAYGILGIHDVTVYGSLGIAAYYSFGIHIIDVSDPTDLKYRGGIAHSVGPMDNAEVDAYAVFMDNAGYIYQSGSGGLYIYRYGVSGVITSNTSYSGDIYIYDTLTVASGVTLTLDAGTHVYMFENALLKVNGSLVANGSSSDSVKFIALGGGPGPGSWQGIYVSSEANSTLSYCLIENCDIGIEMRTDSDVGMSNCSVDNCDTYGIYNYKGYLKLVDSDISANGICGVYGENAVDTVVNTAFDGNESYGIWIDGTTASNEDSYLLGNLIKHTSGEDGSQYGIYVEENDYLNIDSCIVKYYDQGGVLLDNSEPEITNCDIVGDEYYGIYSDNNSFPNITETVFDSLVIGLKALNGNANLGIHPDTSNNAFYLCSSYFVYFGSMLSMSRDSLMAEDCWWNTDDPEAGKFYVDNSRLRRIDYDPYLENDPSPKLSVPLPLEFTAHQNYPNPFNPSTRISFSLEKPGNTIVNVYNILGQKVVTLADDYLEAGDHSVIWDGKNESGSPVASGVFFYTIQSGDNFASKKMLLLR